MRMTPRGRILVSLGVGLCMVGVALWTTYDTSRPSTDTVRAVVAGPAPERTLLTVDDADGDGAADWKQTLPTKPAFIGRTGTTTDSSSVTETHTGELANFILEQLVSDGDALSHQMETSEVIERSESYIRQLATDDLYGRDDIDASGATDAATLRTYGNRVAQITFDNSLPRPVDNELRILTEALDTQDPSLLEDLTLKEASFAGMTEDMLAVRVPRGYAQAHLNLTNAYNAMRVDLAAFQHLFTDPLYTTIRLERYDEDAVGIYQALTDLYTQLYEDGITTWTDADVASQLINTN